MESLEMSVNRVGFDNVMWESGCLCKRIVDNLRAKEELYCKGRPFSL